jgi:hypothetical protein
MTNILSLDIRRKPARRITDRDARVTFHGNLAVVAPPDLIQWLCCANKDWKVHLWGKDLDAELVVKSGELIDARMGNLSGMEALIEIIDCHEGSFELLPIAPVTAPSLSGPWQSLVLTAAQQLDERNFERGLQPKADEPPARPEENTPPVLIMLPGGLNPAGNPEPATVDGLIDAGFAALRAGDPGRAKDCWTRALALDPEHRGIRFNLRKLENMAARTKS